jgi:hypothetical protein
MRRTLAVSIAAMSVLAAAAQGRAAAPRSPAARFAAPVKVTPDLGGGYEPNLAVDRFGNVFASAHKENFQLVVAPDSSRS